MCVIVCADTLVSVFHCECVWACAYMRMCECVSLCVLIHL